MFQRHAIYVVPDGPLGRFGAAWLGWDVRAGRAVALPADPASEHEAATERPRRYGFHATVKPPFRLAQGETAAGLEAALGRLCSGRAAVTIPGLRLTRMGRFLALVPMEPSPELTVLAADVVRDLDRFRAPPTADELARRSAARLSPAQNRNLLAWGYPHVMDQYRFHLTLTGRLEGGVIETAENALAARLNGLIDRPFTVANLSLVGEDAAGRFHELRRCALNKAD